MTSLRIVTRGDDAGSCESANKAVVEAAQAGVLKNVSVMVPGPTFDAAVPLLKELKGVAFGLHVCLNAEWTDVKWGPVSPRESVPSLLDADGNFTAFPNMLDARGFSKAEAMLEVRAQLAKARAAGLDIRYLDEHMGVSWVGFRDELAQLCVDECLVDHAEFDYLGGAATAQDLLALLQGTPPGTYVFVNHPGFDADDMRAFGHVGLAPGQIAAEREKDRLLWLDPDLRQAVADGVFVPVRYDEASC